MAHTPEIDLSTMTVSKDNCRVVRMAEVFLSRSWGRGCVFPVNEEPFRGIVDATDNIIPSDVAMIKRYIVNRLLFLSWTGTNDEESNLRSEF